MKRESHIESTCPHVDRLYREKPLASMPDAELVGVNMCMWCVYECWCMHVYVCEHMYILVHACVCVWCVYMCVMYICMCVSVFVFLSL